MRRTIPILIAAAALASAQAPTIGTLDFYGLRKISEARVRKVLALKEGDRLPASKGAVEENLETLPEVTRAHLEAACCDDSGKAILYVGIEEKGSSSYNYRQPPESHVHLPIRIVEQYARFLEAVRKAGSSGSVAEDLSQGHSLMSDPAVRAVQMEFAETADANLAELRAALREGDSEEHRAIAAYVIGYTKDKAKVINDLQYALQDPDDTVRNNAMRSLTAFAVYGKKNPDSEVRVSATWFVEMLNSIFWGDRNNAAVALVTLTEDRDAKILALLKERSLPSLVEMASFKYLPHALPAYILLARTLGVTEKEAQDLWSGGKRATLIARAKPARQ